MNYLVHYYVQWVVYLTIPLFGNTIILSSNYSVTEQTKWTSYWIDNLNVSWRNSVLSMKWKNVSISCYSNLNLILRIVSCKCYPSLCRVTHREDLNKQISQLKQENKIMEEANARYNKLQLIEAEVLSSNNLVIV